MPERTCDVQGLARPVRRQGAGSETAAACRFLTEAPPLNVVQACDAVHENTWLSTEDTLNKPLRSERLRAQGISEYEIRSAYSNVKRPSVSITIRVKLHAFRIVRSLCGRCSARAADTARKSR